MDSRQHIRQHMQPPALDAKKIFPLQEAFLLMTLEGALCHKWQWNEKQCLISSSGLAIYTDARGFYILLTVSAF